MGVVEPTRRTLTLGDSRELRFAEFGDARGWPILSLHGTPGCRLNRPDDAELFAAGLRLITFDRPGYGGSHRRPGRSVVDCVDDVIALLDFLGIDAFSVTGSSGGGPHALAVAARLGDRIHRARCSVGLVPYDTPDFDWFAGMDPQNVFEFELALSGEGALRSWADAEMAEMLDRVDRDPSTVLGDAWQLSDSDREVLSRPDLFDSVRESTHEMFRQGVDGWVDDSLAFATGWGFDISTVQVPVIVEWSTEDRFVPASHGEWLASHLPCAIPRLRDGEGHMSDPSAAAHRLRALVP